MEAEPSVIQPPDREGPSRSARGLIVVMALVLGMVAASASVAAGSTSAARASLAAIVSSDGPGAIASAITTTRAGELALVAYEPSGAASTQPPAVPPPNLAAVTWRLFCSPLICGGSAAVAIDEVDPFLGLAIVCPATSQCTAVDEGGNAATFNPASPGSPTPTAIDSAGLNSVACPSTSQCTAVDIDGNEVTFDPISPGTPTAMPIDSAGLNAVVCPSASQCTAVDSSGDEVTFEPRSPGLPTPSPISTSSAFDAIACPTTSQCAAVSETGEEVTFDPIQPAKHTTTRVAPDNLNSIACPSRSQCTAVDDGEEVTFNPAQAAHHSTVKIDGGISLLSVACPSTSQCTTIDGNGNQLTFDPAKPGNPALTPIAQPTGHNYSLSSLDCPSASQCTAVDDGGYEVTFEPKLPAPAPASHTGHSSKKSLAWQWNHCYCKETLSPGVPTVQRVDEYRHYNPLLVRTVKDLDSQPRAAAKFFDALNAHGVAIFSSVSFQLSWYYYSPLGTNHGTVPCGDDPPLLPQFPARLITAKCPDGMQLLAIAIYRGKLSSSRATALTVGFLRSAGYTAGQTGCQSSIVCQTAGWPESFASLAAITIVDADLSRGQLLSQTAGSASQTLLHTAISEQAGWTIVNLGVVAFVVKRMPAANPPKLADLTSWVYQIKNGLVAPLVDAMGMDWVEQADIASWSKNFGLGAVETIIETPIPIPILSGLVSIVLDMWGSNQNSGIASEYTQVAAFANESEAVSYAFCIEALLKARLIHAAGAKGALRDTPGNYAKVWTAYATNSGAYTVTVVATGANGRPTTVKDTLDELLGVPSFIAGSS